MARPSIGFRGVENRTQAIALLTALRQARSAYWQRSLSIGVDLSCVDLRGLHEAKIDFNRMQEIQDPFLRHDDVRTILWLRDTEAALRPSDLELALAYGGVGLQVIGIDAGWPNPNHVQEFRWRHPDLDTQLFVSTEMLEGYQQQLRRLVDRFKNYHDSMSGFVFECSLSQHRMVPEPLERILHLLRKHLPTHQLSVSGRFAVSDLAVLDPLLSTIPDLGLERRGVDLQTASEEADGGGVRLLEAAAAHFDRLLFDRAR